MGTIGNTQSFVNISMTSGTMASEGSESPKRKKSSKLLVKPIVSMSFATELMETIGKTNSFHNFHDSWNYVLDCQSPQAIVSAIMEIMETLGFY